MCHGVLIHSVLYFLVLGAILIGPPYVLRYHIYIILDCCIFTVPFAMPVAVESSQCIGVGGCRCSSSCKVSLIILASFAFSISAPIYAFAADAATNLSI